MLDVIAPMANTHFGQAIIVITSTEMATAKELDDAALPETLRESEDNAQETEQPSGFCRQPCLICRRRPD